MKTLVIGAGAISDRWLRVLLADARTTICGLVDPNLEAAHAARTRHGIDVPCYRTLADALSAGPEVLVNLTPPVAHARVSRAALEAGLHVLTEKPLATTISDASSLTKLAAQRGLLLAVMRNRGDDPCLAAFVKLLLQHEITHPYFITASVAVRLREAGFRGMTPLPATTDLAIHGFDQVQQFVTARPLQVSCAELITGFLGGHSSVATMSMSFGDGSVFSYRCGFTGSSMPTSGNGEWRVEASRGTGLWAGGSTAVIATPGRDGPAEVSVGEHEPSYRTSIRSMIDTLAVGGPFPACGPALRSVAMLDAAIASFTAQGRAVEVQRP